MPKRTLAELAETAMAHGLAPDTPAVSVAAATRPDQEVIAGTIADIAGRLADAPSDSPVLVMIGRALADTAAASATLRAAPQAQQGQSGPDRRQAS